MASVLSAVTDEPVNPQPGVADLISCIIAKPPVFGFADNVIPSGVGGFEQPSEAVMLAKDLLRRRGAAMDKQPRCRIDDIKFIEKRCEFVRRQRLNRRLKGFLPRLCATLDF